VAQQNLATELEKEIWSTFDDVLNQHAQGDRVSEVSPETVLLETGLDSLGFAILVSELEMKLGYDPFTICEDAVYPRTYQDFVQFYVDNQPK
jgi:acyl carrier protein